MLIIEIIFNAASIFDELKTLIFEKKKTLLTNSSKSSHDESSVKTV